MSDDRLLHELIAEKLTTVPESVAFVEHEESVSYRQFDTLTLLIMQTRFRSIDFVEIFSDVRPEDIRNLEGIVLFGEADDQPASLHGIPAKSRLPRQRIEGPAGQITRNGRTQHCTGT